MSGQPRRRDRRQRPNRGGIGAAGARTGAATPARAAPGRDGIRFGPRNWLRHSMGRARRWARCPRHAACN